MTNNLLAGASALALTMALSLAEPALAQNSPSAFTHATRYDASGRVTGTIAPDPDGAGPLRHAATRNSYDAAGRPTRVETGELADWQSEEVAPSAWPGFTKHRQVDTAYDVTGHKLTEGASSQGTIYSMTQYSYDTSGRLTCTATRMNPAAFGSLPASACTLGAEGVLGPDRITRNVYDAASQVVQVRQAVGTSIEQGHVTYAYTANGRRSDVIDAKGNRASFVYDGFDRQEQWQFPSAATVGGFDDATPETALATAGAVNTADYEAYGYDRNGNRTSWRKRDGRQFAFAYDLLNRVTSKVVPDGCAPIQAGPCPAASATRDVHYAYDLVGQQTAARFDSPAGVDAVLHSYDGFGQITSTTTSRNGTSHTLAFQSDADGNRVRVQHPDGTTFVHGYDGLDRLVGVSLVGGVQLAGMSYDAEGRRAGATVGGVSSGYGYDQADKSGRLRALTHDLAGAASDVTTTFDYNPAGQIVSEVRGNDAYAYTGGTNAIRSYTANGLNQYSAVDGAAMAYDANGNMISNGSVGYGYDAENRLVSSSAGTTLGYDAAGRLSNVGGGQAETTHFLYDGDQLTAEYGSSFGLLRRYVHGTGEDDPLIWFEGAGMAGMRTMQSNHQGSVVSVADTGGVAVAVNAYDEYGVPAFANFGRFQYTGQAWMPELGMYHYKARVYAPRLGRFLQTDPIGYDDQVNLYTYVANNPLNSRDPSGTQTLLQAARAACLTAPQPCVLVALGLGLLGATTVSSATKSDLIVNGHVNSASALPPPKQAIKTESQSAAEAVMGVAAPPPQDPDDEPEYRTRISNQAGKDAASDTPSWARGHAPKTTENGKQFATRLMKDQYGKDWAKSRGGTGPTSEFQKIKKFGDRAFE